MTHHTVQVVTLVVVCIGAAASIAHLVLHWRDR